MSESSNVNHATEKSPSGERGRQRKSSAQKGRNVRLSDELYEAADSVAEATLRSAQKQLEYWAQLGRLADGMLTNVEAAALLSNDSFISEISLFKNSAPRADDIMAEIQQDRANGALKAKVTHASVVYDVAEDGLSIRRIDTAGNVTIGSLVDGSFVEANSNANVVNDR